jgi:hypothetical protein
VDDLHIFKRVNGLDRRWSHLLADTVEELHAFAEQLGLRRAWFQDPVVNGRPRPKPGSRAAEGWHYDVTDSKRERAIALGAEPIRWWNLYQVIDARVARRLYAWASDDGPEAGALHVVGIHHLASARPVAERFLEAASDGHARMGELLAGEPERRWALFRPVDRGQELDRWVQGPGDGAVAVLTWPDACHNQRQRTAAQQSRGE